jgi:hypothetical protein
MAFSKVVVEDKIEIMELGQIQVRTKTSVLEDSVELSASFGRHVVEPCFYNGSAWVDTDTSGMSARVQALATATWTDATVAAYKNYYTRRVI